MQNELITIQVDSTEKHIRQVENLYQSIRSIKHDMTKEKKDGHRYGVSISA